MSNRPVALITKRNPGYFGIPLARLMARAGHDLVLHTPAQGANHPIPESENAGLAVELERLGAQVEMVPDADINTLEGNQRLVDAAMNRFGRLDAACLITGRMIFRDFLETAREEWEDEKRDNIDSVFYGLQAVLPPMIAAGTGRVLVSTSSLATRPEPRLSLYSATKACANALVRAAAFDYSEHGVAINAIGTSFMDAMGFKTAFGADEPGRRAELEAQVPLRRLGTVEEVAEFAAVLLDGRCHFQTGQFFNLSGGWSH